MARFKVGVLDISAAAVVLIAIVLPPRTPRVRDLYAGAPEATVRAIAEAEAQLAADPGDGAAAERLVDLLIATGQEDWALRVAGTAAAQVDSPTRWRSLRAVSTTHAERVEIKEAHDYAQQALAACRAGPASCPAHEEVRLSLYFEQLDAGVRSGIDPRSDPAAFRAALNKAIPWATVRTKQ